ncbi:hypothetical protein F5I97DRAFT_1927579 [Phlebopus sp. FC_14]|nr:hypothetical protein F5I97DRAFT_1927579 [Phlebopus sp. FC_14]
MSRESGTQSTSPMPGSWVDFILGGVFAFIFLYGSVCIARDGSRFFLTLWRPLQDDGPRPRHELTPDHWSVDDDDDDDAWTSERSHFSPEPLWPYERLDEPAQRERRTSNNVSARHIASLPETKSLPLTAASTQVTAYTRNTPRHPSSRAAKPSCELESAPAASSTSSSSSARVKVKVLRDGAPPPRRFPRSQIQMAAQTPPMTSPNSPPSQNTPSPTRQARQIGRSLSPSPSSSSSSSPSPGPISTNNNNTTINAAHSIPTPAPTPTFPSKPLVIRSRSRKIVDVQGYTQWHESSSSSPLDRPPPHYIDTQPNNNNNDDDDDDDPIRLYVHRVCKPSSTDLDHAQLWVMKGHAGAEWVPVDVTRTVPPIGHWEFVRYVLWMTKNGEPSWVTRGSWSSYMARWRKENRRSEGGGAGADSSKPEQT